MLGEWITSLLVAVTAAGKPRLFGGRRYEARCKSLNEA